APMSAVGFRRMITRLGKAAKMPFSVHPHMLRHACGLKLANDGVDTRALQHFLGHRKPLRWDLEGLIRLPRGRNAIPHCDPLGRPLGESREVPLPPPAETLADSPRANSESWRAT